MSVIILLLPLPSELHSSNDLVFHSSSVSFSITVLPPKSLSQTPTLEGPPLILSVPLLRNPCPICSSTLPAHTNHLYHLLTEHQPRLVLLPSSPDSITHQYPHCLTHSSPPWSLSSCHAHWKTKTKPVQPSTYSKPMPRQLNMAEKKDNIYGNSCHIQTHDHKLQVSPRTAQNSVSTNPSALQF